MSTPLPPWPKKPYSLAAFGTSTTGPLIDHAAARMYVGEKLDAALARLRACEPYMQHLDGCKYDFTIGTPEIYCLCGLYELLADLLPPQEG